MKQYCELTRKEFQVTAQEVEYCKKENIPFPTVSPAERQRQMLYFRNRMHLYRTKCALSGKEIFSSVPPETKIPVYDGAVWESDDWDAADYAQEYDFSRSFFEQFHELFIRVPRPNLGNTAASLENCDYTNGIARAKNCYLLFSSHNAEDCYFSKAVYRVKNVVDSLLVYDTEICFDCENIKDSYNVIGCKHSLNCRDSYFLFNCIGCSNCFGCVNLTRREFCFFNEQLTKEAYSQRLSEINLGSHQQYFQQKRLFEEHCLKFPVKFYSGSQNENFSGNFINNSKDCHNSFFVSKSETIVDSIYLESAKNSILHVNFGGNSELTYNCISVGDNSFNLKFCSDTWNGVRDLEYCINVRNGTHDSFGCVGLKKSSYCILNKKYSKEEYFDLVKRIKSQMSSNGEYGKFFPISSSPNYYNRSDVEEFFPLERQEAVSRKFNWLEETEQALLTRNSPPDDITHFALDQTSNVFTCEETGKGFKITKPEIEFYKKHSLPPPTVAPMERLRKRCREFFQIKELNKGQCSRCERAILTTYAGKANQELLCEACFQLEL